MKRPEFHLTRVFENGVREPPQILRVADVSWDTRMDRRGAIGTGLGLAGALSLLSACRREPPPSECTPEPNRDLLASNFPVYILAFTSDGRLLVTCAGMVITVWSMATGSALRSVSLEDAATAVAVSRFANVIAVGDERGLVVHSEGEAEAKRQFEAGGVVAVAMPDDETVIAATATGELLIWSYTGNATPVAFASGPFTALAVTPNGKTLLSGSRSGEIRFWRLSDRKSVGVIHSSTSVKSLSVAPDGDSFLTLDEKGAVRRWSIDDRKELPLRTDISGATAMALGVEGSVVVLAKEHELAVFDIGTGRRMTTLKHGDGIQQVSAPLDGRFVAAALEQGRVIVWDLFAWRRRGRCQAGYLFDREGTDKDVQASAYEITEDGEEITYTLNCNAPAPAGATCTCNCVAGTRERIRWGEPLFPDQSPGVGGSVCTCNKVCTCVPISSRRWKTNITALSDSLELESNDVRVVAVLVEAIKTQQRRLAALEQLLAAL